MENKSKITNLNTKTEKVFDFQKSTQNNYYKIENFKNFNNQF